MRYPYILRQILKLLLITILVTFSGRATASHIVGADMFYTHVTGNTYKVTVVLYGDCGPASAGAFATLSSPSASPVICLYDGSTYHSTLNLSAEPPVTGIEITPVCPDSLPYTQCILPSNHIPGIKKFTYSRIVALPYQSGTWRFIFNGAYGPSTAGRATAITNILSGTTIQLIDTLNNLTAPNSNPTMTNIPTPFFCLNQPNGYNPGAVDGDGDRIVFSLVPATDGTMGCSTIGGNVTYTGTAWPGQLITATTPLQCVASSYFFDTGTGQMIFFPNVVQRSVVVYNIREYRGGVLVGTCQREMTFLVHPCINLPPAGIYDSATAGTITDSTHFEICSGSGPFSIFMNPTDPEGQVVNVTVAGLPAGATFTTVGNGTPTPHCTFSWNTTGVPPGDYVFFVTFKDNNCPESGTHTRAFTVTITPPLPPITGVYTVCPGSTTTLSIASAGGTWSASPVSVATVSATGVVTGISPGTATISYESSAGCLANVVVTVDPGGIGSVSGPTDVCVGSTITLSHPFSGGTWSVSGSAASVSTGGVVTGISAGTVTVSYTTTTDCGTHSFSHIVTVTAPPTVAPITGPSTLCTGSTIALSDATPGGVWSTASAGVSVSPAGIVTGLSSGTATISYTVTNICGSATATKEVTVDITPGTVPLSGATSVCMGGTILLSYPLSGGTWSSSSPAVATVSAGGLVTGISAGTATISYDITNACGSAVVTTVITVDAMPVAGPVTGPSTVCVSMPPILLSNSTPGGTWSSSSANATVSSTGLVTAVSPGTATISYTVTNSCGTVVATTVITINPAPGVAALTGPTSVCAGNTIALTYPTAGGTWGSSNPAVAIVSPGGIVTGIASGTATVSYTVITICGSVTASAVVTVEVMPVVTPITGPTTLCTGGTIALSNATPGGVWSSGSSNASVTTGGIVSGVSAGTAVISYTVSNSCGSAVAATVITINPVPGTSILTGPAAVCMGSTIVLTASVPGGTWTSTVPAVATVSGSDVVTGIAPGTTTISYVITTSCGTSVSTMTITVDDMPVAGPISGPASLCAGASIVLTTPTPGGTWSSGSSNATVSAGGVVSGITAGTATISYTITNACGTAVATTVVTVDPIAGTGPLTGPTAVCAGSTITIPAPAPGGTWTSTAPAVATISAGGVVTGISGGTATISYVVTTTCGTATLTALVTVNTIPVVDPITGPTSLCTGGTITLSNATPGGVWSSGSPEASVSSTGVVTGITAGTATISYTVTNACGSVTASIVVTVNPSPGSGTVSGPTSVCVGSTAALSFPVSGGTWSCTPSSVATISSSGVVTGVAPGTATITYIVTTACGTATVNSVITVDDIPVVAPITGATTPCTGTTVVLSNATPGGVWSSSSSNATVSATGVVTGVTAGIATISYTVTNACGSATASIVVTINPSPGTGTLTGAGSVCIGDTISAGFAVSGGTWSCTPATVATITPTGIITGISTGTAIVSYVLTTSCGTTTITRTITVNPLPTITPITGPTSVCVGSTIMLSNATPGGTWSTGSSNASVSATGIVSGISAGTATISYSVGNSCDTISVTYVITIDTLPAIAAITGPDTLCAGATVTLANATPGGTWSSTNPAVATISSAGVVTGIAGGTTTISYALTNSCGTVAATAVITVNPLPTVLPITGPSSVCVGLTITLADATPGGTWSSSGTAATVSATGVVTGVSGGTITVSYSVSNSCGTVTVTKIVTVNLFPDAGVISGPDSVCTGSAIILTSTIPGGTWSSPDPAVSVSSGGVVTGIAAGTALISYTLVNGCGPATATYVVTVNPLPDPGVVTGGGAICTGNTLALSATVAGGIWSITGSAASIGSTGIVTGLTVGTAVVSYTVTDGICDAHATSVVTVNTLPDPGIITADSAICEHETITATCSVTGGVWSCSSPAVSVSPTGVVTGLTSGLVTLSYTVTNMCGPATATKLISVYPGPDPGTITGDATLCIGATTTITTSSPAGTGTWSSSNPAIATIDEYGNVTSIATGTTTIQYIITNTIGCTGTATHILTVAPLPDPGIVGGPQQPCTGAVITLTQTETGGTWSSSNPAIASIDAATGEVHATGTGIVVITYTTAPNSDGCTNSTTYPLHILPSAPFLLNADIEAVHCYGGNDGAISVSVSAGGSGQYDYVWSNGSTAASVSGLKAGNYVIEVTDLITKCYGARTITVPEPDSLDIKTSVKNDLCFTGNGKVALTVTGGTPPYTYLWSAGGGEDHIDNLSKGTYTADVSDAHQCRKEARADVLDGDCDEIDVTTGISPNGDGTNDYWLIRGVENYPHNVVQLYDKWGDLIFEQRGYTNNWDGRGRNGSLVPDGTYFYVIKLNATNGAGGKNVLTGSLLVKR